MNEKDRERVIYKVHVEPNTGCWLWLGEHDRRGYGRFRQRPPYGPYVMAHRVVYDLVRNTTVPNYLDLDHLCRTPSCVNPDHLEPVTHLENMRRAFALKTHCPKGHPYAGDNVRIGTSKGYPCRFCRACHRARYHDRKQVAR